MTPVPESRPVRETPQNERRPHAGWPWESEGMTVPETPTAEGAAERIARDHVVAALSIVGARQVALLLRDVAGDPTLGGALPKAPLIWRSPIAPVPLHSWVAPLDPETPP